MEFFGMRVYASRLVPPDRLLAFDGATTHAIVNLLPAAETRHAWYFWRAVNPRLAQLADEAGARWLVAGGEGTC
jgi:hypothetical protein